MATRTKTIEFAATQLNTLADNTLTAFTTFTAYIPEFSGTVTIRKAIVMVTWQEGAGHAVSGAYSSRRIDVSVGGAGATSYTNANSMGMSTESAALYYSADATTHFTTNWTTGTSKTIAISVLVDTTAATPAMVNVGATIYITYDYDDTQTTQIKTVYIPLDAPITTLATAKPAAIATIPALDTELPEASKTYRNMYIIAEGNINSTASATDSTISMQIDSLTAYTSQTTEQGNASDWYSRLVYDITALGMTTNATHSFYIWGSVARANHQQCYLVVTYEFSASSSNNMFVSVRIPAIVHSVIGGTTSSDYNRAVAELYIAEPATITTKQLAFMMHWDGSGAISGFNVRLGTGSFVTYTDGGGTQCGGNSLMIRNDSAYTLVRGKNTLTADFYQTGAQWGFTVSGYFIVNYTCAKPTNGYGAANRTILYNLGTTFNTNASASLTVAATAPVITSTYKFFSAIGFHYMQQTVTTQNAPGMVFLAEQLSSENYGVAWRDIKTWIDVPDNIPGMREQYINGNELFATFNLNGDIEPGLNKLSIEASRRYRMFYANGTTVYNHIDAMIVVHHNTYTVSGTVSGSAGGTVTLRLYRDTDGKLLDTTTRTGNGSYSFTWMDNVDEVFVEARESGTLLGRSEKGVAT